jgi:hypothetical protein
MRRIFREPLFQFLLIGAGLFFLYALVNQRQEKGEIVIDDNLIRELTAKWQMEWNKSPQPDDLKGLLQSYVEQEALYREALSMHLDHNDEIVKRRMVQKMEFLSEDMAAAPELTDSMLRAYFNIHKSRYVRPARYTLRQVFFSRDSRADAWGDARRALAGGDPETAGDRLGLPSRYANASGDRLGEDFGSDFSAALDTLPVGKWSGPVISGYGIHLVFIEAKQASDVARYEEVAARVSADCRTEAERKLRKEWIASLLKKYPVRIDVSDTALKKSIGENF